MVRKSFTPEQIISKLRETEIHINQGISIAGVESTVAPGDRAGKEAQEPGEGERSS